MTPPPADLALRMSDLILQAITSRRGRWVAEVTIAKTKIGDEKPIQELMTPIWLTYYLFQLHEAGVIECRSNPTSRSWKAPS